MFMLLGIVFFVIGLVCSIMILVNAFQDEVWKGVLCLFCGLYALYYALAEYDGDNKWLVVIGAIVGGALSGVFFNMAGMR